MSNSPMIVLQGVPYVEGNGMSSLYKLQVMVSVFVVQSVVVVCVHCLKLNNSVKKKTCLCRECRLTPLLNF